MMADWFKRKIKPLADWILLTAKEDSAFSYQDYLDIKRRYHKIFN